MTAPAFPQRIGVLSLPNHAPGGGGTLVGVGAAVDVSHFQDLTIQVAGTFSATVVIEGSVDGTNWSTAAMDFSLASSFTAVGFSRYIAPSPVFLRVNITVWVSGTPTVQVSGGKR